MFHSDIIMGRGKIVGVKAFGNSVVLSFKLGVQCWGNAKTEVFKVNLKNTISVFQF